MDATNATPSRSGGLIRRALTSRWREFLAFWFLATAGFGYLAYREIPPVYRASSLLRVLPSQTDLYDLNQGTQDHFDGFLKTQVSLISSPNVLTAAGTSSKAVVLPRIQAAGDVVLELRRVIQVAVVPNTYLIEVSMNSPSAHEAATLVNAVVDAFIESNSEWTDGMARVQIKNLEKSLGDLRTQSDEKEHRWRELVRRANGGVKSADPGLKDGLAKLDAKRVENDLQRLEAQSRLDALDQLVGEKKVAEGEVDAQRPELMTKVRAAELLEKALAEKALHLGHPGPNEQDAIELALLQEGRTSLIGMRQQVSRRLEELKFESRNEARIRAINVAVPPGVPTHRGRLPMALAMTPFATFFASLGLFAAIEGVAGPRKPRKPEADFGAI